MNNQQKCLLEMLKEIHAICVANDIDYYMGGGTLIGAVRNGGFLPWDDDADVIMTYDNWEKFKKACETDLPPNRHLSSADIQESYGHIVPRYVSTTTTAIHASQTLHDDVAGEVVDVFVLDPIGDGEEAYHAYLKDMYLYNSVVNYDNVAGVRFEVDPQEYMRYIELCHEKGKLYVAGLLEERLRSHFDASGSRYAYRWQGVPVCFERSWFESTRLLPFEDTQLYGMVGANEFLVSYFGEEWVEVPGRISPAKHEAASSLRFPYTEALEYYRPTYDRSDLIAQMEERRRLCLENARDVNRLEDEKARIAAAICAAEVGQRIAGHEDEFREALESADVQQLEQFLCGYIDWQLSKGAVGRHSTSRFRRYEFPVLADVPDEVFTGALYVLMGTERIHSAARLLAVREQLGLPFCTEMREVARLISAFRESMNDYQYGRYAEGFEKAMAVRKESPVDVVASLRLACMHARELTKDDLGARSIDLAQLIDEGRSVYPDDGFFEKLEGDLLFARGLCDEAKVAWIDAAENTRNGLILTEIAQQTGYYPSWLRTPSWAKAAGVPQWSGETPRVRSVARKRPRAGGLDDRIEHLFDLLVEVTEACERAGVDYIVAPDAACALFVQGKKPDEVGAFSIWCRFEDMELLERELIAPGLGNRSVEIEKLGWNQELSWIRYCGLDTTYIDYRRVYSEHNCLFVSIMPLCDPRRDCARANSRGGFFTLVKRVRALVSGLRRRPVRGVFAECSEDDYLATMHHRPCVVARDCIESTESREFGAHSFRAPKKLEEYLALSPNRNVGGALLIEDDCVSSCAIRFAELVDAGAVPPDLQALTKLVRNNGCEAGRIRKRFRKNFNEVKLAVALKDVSIDLLPQKDHILSLAESGDYAALGKIFERYAACEARFAKVGPFVFDDDIHKVYLDFKAHRGC